jgi:K+-sensing histidine kinase KdpD
LRPDPTFARLVSLACHDLRTPLATVHGFARTIERLEPLPEKTARYVGMIADASAEMADLLDRLALVARIEGGRYDPPLTDVDSLELARAAADLVDAADVTVEGSGEEVTVDREPTERAVAALVEAMLRHGDAESARVQVARAELRLAPVTETAGPVLLGEELRDLGAETARRVVAALGGSVSLQDETLVVALPTSAGATTGGP